MGKCEKFRPYYGIMSVSHRTTETLDSLDHEELGGWGKEYTLFGAHNRIDAINAGYIEGDKNHKLLFWNAEVYSAPEGGNKTVERPGLVVRFLHYFGDEVNEED